MELMDWPLTRPQKMKWVVKCYEMEIQCLEDALAMRRRDSIQNSGIVLGELDCQAPRASIVPNTLLSLAPLQGRSLIGNAIGDATGSGSVAASLSAVEDIIATLPKKTCGKKESDDVTTVVTDCARLMQDQRDVCERMRIMMNQITMLQRTENPQIAPEAHVAPEPPTAGSISVPSRGASQQRHGDQDAESDPCSFGSCSSRPAVDESFEKEECAAEVSSETLCQQAAGFGGASLQEREPGGAVWPDIEVRMPVRDVGLIESDAADAEPGDATVQLDSGITLAVSETDTSIFVPELLVSGVSGQESPALVLPPPVEEESEHKTVASAAAGHNHATGTVEPVAAADPLTADASPEGGCDEDCCSRSSSGTQSLEESVLSEDSIDNQLEIEGEELEEEIHSDSQDETIDMLHSALIERSRAAAAEGASVVAPAAQEESESWGSLHADNLLREQQTVTETEQVISEDAVAGSLRHGTLGEEVSSLHDLGEHVQVDEFPVDPLGTQLLFPPEEEGSISPLLQSQCTDITKEDTLQQTADALPAVTAEEKIEEEPLQAEVTEGMEEQETQPLPVAERVQSASSTSTAMVEAVLSPPAANAAEAEAEKTGSDEEHLQDESTAGKVLEADVSCDASLEGTTPPAATGSQCMSQDGLSQEPPSPLDAAPESDAESSALQSEDSDAADAVEAAARDKETSASLGVHSLPHPWQQEEVDVVLPQARTQGGRDSPVPSLELADEDEEEEEEEEEDEGGDEEVSTSEASEDEVEQVPLGQSHTPHRSIADIVAADLELSTCTSLGIEEIHDTLMHRLMNRLPDHDGDD
mmetsp:Transcript_30935/g.72140  ORF Transcript_30935/g.72140 Transcript_30935/m.72140 type:complete len:816 (-) Transcript_30935:298-2745(-)